MIHFLTGEHLLELLHRVAAGADPETVYLGVCVDTEQIDEEGEDE